MTRWAVVRIVFGAATLWWGSGECMSTRLAFSEEGELLAKERRVLLAMASAERRKNGAVVAEGGVESEVPAEIKSSEERLASPMGHGYSTVEESSPLVQECAPVLAEFFRKLRLDFEEYLDTAKQKAERDEKEFVRLDLARVKFTYIPEPFVEPGQRLPLWVVLDQSACMPGSHAYGAGDADRYTIIQLTPAAVYLYLSQPSSLTRQIVTRMCGLPKYVSMSYILWHELADFISAKDTKFSLGLDVDYESALVTELVLESVQRKFGRRKRVSEDDWRYGCSSIAKLDEYLEQRWPADGLAQWRTAFNRNPERHYAADLETWRKGRLKLLAGIVIAWLEGVLKLEQAQ